MSHDGMAAVDAVEAESTLHTIHLYEITVDPSQQGQTVLMDVSDVGESAASLQADLGVATSLEGLDTEENVPLAVFQAVDDLGGLDSGEHTEVVVMSEGQEELVNGLTAAILSQGHGLLMNDSTLAHTEEAVASLHVEDLTGAAEELCERETQVIAYFETIPNVLSTDGFTFSPDTVLSSALSPTPIASTLPIVSKRVPPPPASLVLTVERLHTDSAEGEDGELDEEDGEQPEQQLEEHW